MVCRLQPVPDRSTVPHKLHDARLLREWNHHVRPVTQFSVFRSSIPTEELVGQLKHLFHHSVLPELVVALEL
jgi:hypothetical protein